MTIAGDIARFCVEVAERPLPPEVENRARLCLADHLHAAMHGARSETGDRLLRYFAVYAAPPAALSDPGVASTCRGLARLLKKALASAALSMAMCRAERTSLLW